MFFTIHVHTNQVGQSVVNFSLADNYVTGTILRTTPRNYTCGNNGSTPFNFSEDVVGVTRDIRKFVRHSNSWWFSYEEYLHPVGMVFFVCCVYK